MKLQILKTGLVFLALNLILVFTTNAQVGIGTTDPKSSLQVEGNPSDTTTPDGVQVPSLTITQLEGKIIGGAYGADQDGAMVYISDASIGSTISETADIKNKGFYFYFHNGVSGVWRIIGEQKIDLTNPDRVPKWDGTNLIEGSIIDSGGNIGIGTLTPDALLDVEGSFQFKDGSEGDTKLLTSDSDGNASWQSIKPENVLGTGNAPQPDFNCLSTVGSLEIGPAPMSVAVSSNYAYVVDSSSDDLKVIDVSIPASPILSGSLDLGSEPLSVAVSGNYAYVVDSGSDDLKVIDVTNPASPMLSGSLGIGSNPRAVAVSGNYAYVVDQGFDDDLKVIDVSNPASPILSGSLGIGSNPWAVAVSGNYAYVVDLFSDDLKVIDVSNPASPILSGSLGIGSNPWAVAVFGNYAYVVDDGSGDLKVIDVSNPASPILSGALGIGSTPWAVAVSGNYAYVVDTNSDDLKVIDVSNPSSPLLLGSLDIGSYPLSVAVSGNYAYVVDQGFDDDLKVIELSCIPSLAINPLTGDFETVTESDPQVAATTANAIPKWDGTSLIDGSIIDSGGNVGIGITSPASILHVENNISVGDFVNYANSVDYPRFSNTNDGQSYGIRVSANDDLGNEKGITIGVNPDANGGTTIFATEDNSFPIGIIHSSNFVGIGTLDPTSRLHVSGDITGTRLSTGHGFNELYAMNQNMRTFDNVTFNRINTGPGMTEVHLMNQNLRTTDAVTFNGGISWNNGVNNINDVTGSFGSVQVNGGGVSGWEGFSINGRAVFMHDGSNTTGIFDDVNNHWLLQSQSNGGTYLYYNGSSKMFTNNDGIFVIGRINTGHGATDVYAMNQNVRTFDAVSFGTVNTGQGANELYAMNQNVRTIDNVTFNRIRAGSGITSTEGTLHIKAEDGVFPSLLLEGGSEDISFPDGDALQFGHWNFSNNTFTERLRINSSGNVGIGTTDIDFKLEVNGSAGKPGGSSWSNSSDRRLKQNINPYNEGLKEIVEISPVTYQYNELSGYDTEIEYVGVIAQELLKVAPHMVSTYEIDGVEYYKIDNSAMTYMLINAVKELKAENEILKEKINKIDEMNVMMSKLKAQLDSYAKVENLQEKFSD